MALNKAEQSQVRSLMKEDRWDIVIKFLGEKLDQWRSEKIVGQNAFESLRMLHTRDGKVEGVNEFFEQLERGAFDN